MKKYKKLKLLLFFFVIMLLSSCQLKEDKLQSNKIDSGNYQISTHNYTELSISINYPQLSGLEDKELENIINDKIKSMFISNFLNNWEQDGLSVETTYEITLKNKNYLSILCASELYVAETIHPNKFNFGLTIDIVSGELLNIDDVITIQQFQDYIKGKHYNIEPSSLKEVISFENYVNMPRFSSVVYSDSFNYCSFYLTDDSICYLLEISHAYGDVATIIFPQESR